MTEELRNCAVYQSFVQTCKLEEWFKFTTPFQLRFVCMKPDDLINLFTDVNKNLIPCRSGVIELESFIDQLEYFKPDINIRFFFVFCQKEPLVKVDNERKGHWILLALTPEGGWIYCDPRGRPISDYQIPLCPQQESFPCRIQGSNPFCGLYCVQIANVLISKPELYSTPNAFKSYIQSHYITQKERNLDRNDYNVLRWFIDILNEAILVKKEPVKTKPKVWNWLRNAWTSK